MIDSACAFLYRTVAIIVVIMILGHIFYNNITNNIVMARVSARAINRVAYLWKMRFVVAH